ncbi:ABC transporter permease [Psychroserpens sp.]|uniref:ABC transporter permease n=1 Tax=Psychroserpens sp. TaxID=2020870 RepID=UPI001B2AD364|nr:ABC transporter permease [Psychroserpens sp.]MBO6607656.1 ABC transporter permease [Psychroserpens sp.]MBO6630837.1 ABC transporter permease [Psychroserpens sp.]MBO6655032.1 ABC transporter permease [Psychroserpens sp.]MBO6683163.1 ABC transporter permease [Psychroserpens sp.]MBO6749658.1 ABC transporter permease [Psychroserpens sp.]
MFRYLLNKIAYALLTLLGVVTVIFFLFNVLPGDPAQMMLGQNEDSEQIAIVKAKYGFDKPIATQYAYYLNDLSPISFHSTNNQDYTYLEKGKYTASQLFQIGNTNTVLKFPYLRESFTKQGKKVSQVIGETLPNTFVLAVSAIAIAIILGVCLGIVSALFKDRWLDKFIQIFSTLGMSVPSFFSAILFAWFFGYVLHDYTNLEMTGSLYELDDFGERVQIKWKNLILPAIVLGIRPLAVVIQLMRNSLLEVFNQDYIRTARAKGLSEFQIIKRHAVKNALNPVVTAISGWFASMLAGAVFVEYIFGWNGLGKEIVNALNTLDLPVIMGSVLVIALLFIVINIFVDVIYGWLDPKVKLK